MSPNLTSVLAAAESLPLAERRELIELLLQGLDESTEGETDGETSPLSEAWRQEIARRSAEYDLGHAETVSWEEIQDRWQERRGKGG
jgi:putative addiction module component (TIGR02574 family)